MKNAIFFSQTKYFRDILKMFEMENYKEVATPMSTSCYIDVDLAGKFVDQTKFIRLIGSLLYLTVSGPYIKFIVCMCARSQSNHKDTSLLLHESLNTSMEQTMLVYSDWIF